MPERSIHNPDHNSILDLGSAEAVSEELIRERGRVCGEGIISTMTDEDLRELRNTLLHAKISSHIANEEISLALREYGASITFRSPGLAMAFCDGILGAIRRRVAARIATMTKDEAHAHVYGFWRAGAYEGMEYGCREESCVMTGEIYNIPMNQNPVTVRVRCSGSYHHVTWQDHRSVLQDHPKQSVPFLEAMNVPGCVEILQTIRTDSLNADSGWCQRSTRVPARLWGHVQSSISTLRHLIDPAKWGLQQRCIQEKLHIPSPRLRLSTEPPQIAVWIPGLSQATHQPLATYQDGQWRVDRNQWKIDREVAQALTSLVPPGGSNDRAADQCWTLWAVRKGKIRSGVFVDALRLIPVEGLRDSTGPEGWSDEIVRTLHLDDSKTALWLPNGERWAPIFPGGFQLADAEQRITLKQLCTEHNDPYSDKPNHWIFVNIDQPDPRHAWCAHCNHLVDLELDHDKFVKASNE